MDNSVVGAAWGWVALAAGNDVAGAQLEMKRIAKIKYKSFIRFISLLLGVTLLYKSKKKGTFYDYTKTGNIILRTLRFAYSPGTLCWMKWINRLTYQRSN